MNSIVLKLDQQVGAIDNALINPQTENRSNRLIAYGIILLLSFFFLNSARATHVIGGGITYSQLENNNYLLTVKLYRDCNPGNAPLPNTVNVQCRRGFDGSTPNGYGFFNLPMLSSQVLSPAIPACAFDPGVCVEEAVYQSIVNIPPGPGGYHLYYTICCRNGTIDNIINPLNTRETFYAYVPNNGTLSSGQNSSPYFVDVPPVYVCAGQPLDLNFAANDFDGDSLVYYFYTPYDGQNNGGINYGAGAPPNNINISPVNWQAGFNATDPLDQAPGFAPGLNINNTGLITGIPPMAGQYVVGVMVDEYRDGVLIGRISRDFQFNVINCPPPLEAIVDITTNCNGLTIDFLNQSTGQNPSAWWDFGTGNPADSSVVWQPTFNYPMAGTYDVTLILEKGTACADTAIYQVTVMDPVAFNVNVDSVSCTGLMDGVATAVATDPTYQYLWSTQQNGNSISNLAPANYWVEAMNTVGCVDTQQFTVFEPLPLAVQFIETEPLCNGDLNGSLEAVVSGGTAPYSYFWPGPNQSTSILQNVGAGNYTVQITDNNGCFHTDNSTIAEPTALNAWIMNYSDVSCKSLSDGSVFVGVMGGSPGYYIDWLTLQNDNFHMTGLSAGTYIAEVTDDNGCLEIINVTIEEPDTFYVDIHIIEDETCTDGNAVAFADVTNGIGAISFNWTPTGQTTPLATGLAAGQVQVNVQDENGCTDQAFATIVNHATGVASIGNTSPVSCLNGNDGMIEINMTGGTAPFTYNWSCNCPTNQNVLNNLTAGNYYVNVEDHHGCIDSIAFTIDELPELLVDITGYIEPSCNGLADGELTAIANGGTAPYAYSWNTNPVQNNAIATGLSTGSYTVTVTDDNGCQAQIDTLLNEPSQLIANAQVIGNIICHGDSAGVAIVQGIGGTGPYTYYWTETAETTDTIANLLAGFYNVTVTDDNGCQATDQVEIIEYAAVNAVIIADSVFCPGDMVDFYVSSNGLNNMYDYYWYVNSNLESTSNTLSHPIYDTSMVQIVLVNIGNCPDVQANVKVGPIKLHPNAVSAFATPDTICYGSSTSLSATLADTAYITSVFWNDPLLSGLGPHLVSPDTSFNYIITVENVCGEQAHDTAKIDVFTPPNAHILAEGTSGCEMVETAFNFAYDAYDYDFVGAYWTINNQNYDSQNPIITYNHTSDVMANAYLTFSNGCTFEYSDIVYVEVFENPDADFYYNPNPAYVDEETEFVDISKGNPKVWEWYVDGQFVSSIERPTHVFNEVGDYLVTQIIFDENGCTDTMEHNVEIIGNYTVYVPNAFTPDGSGYNNTFKPVVTEVDPDGYEFMIFNRWGEIIFQTEVIDDAWDGTYLNENVRDGVYVWKVIVTDNVGLEHEFVGHVTLLR